MIWCGVCGWCGAECIVGIIYWLIYNGRYITCVMDRCDPISSIFRCVLRVFHIVFHIFPGFCYGFGAKLGIFGVLPTDR